jgi:hypothetical protein
VLVNGQTRPITAKHVKNNVIEAINDVRDQEKALKNKRNTVRMYNMKPTVHGQRKLKKKSNYKLCF